MKLPLIHRHPLIEDGFNTVAYRLRVGGIRRALEISIQEVRCLRQMVLMIINQTQIP